jgi:hypothetical protein
MKTWKQIHEDFKNAKSTWDAKNFGELNFENWIEFTYPNPPQLPSLKVAEAKQLPEVKDWDKENIEVLAYKYADTLTDDSIQSIIVGENVLKAFTWLLQNYSLPLLPSEQTPLKELRDLENRLYKCGVDNAKLIGEKTELQCKLEEIIKASEDTAPDGYLTPEHTFISMARYITDKDAYDRLFPTLTPVYFSPQQNNVSDAVEFAEWVDDNFIVTQRFGILKANVNFDYEKCGVSPDIAYKISRLYQLYSESKLK